MARIQNLKSYNETRDLIKVALENDEAVLLSREEIKDLFLAYLDKEYDLISTKIGNNQKKRLFKFIDEKIVNLQTILLKHIDEKFDKVSEKIITKLVSSEIELEVKNRVELKLNEFYKDNLVKLQKK